VFKAIIYEPKHVLDHYFEAIHEMLKEHVRQHFQYW
jgi:hypothetical protein